MGEKQKKPAAESVASSQPPASRVIIDQVTPNIDHGRFPAKCALGQTLKIEAIVLCDGHETLKVDLLYRHVNEQGWQRRPMTLRYNDTYFADVKAESLTGYVYTVEASIDRFGGWRDAFFKKLKAGEAVEADALAGSDIIKNFKTAGFTDNWRDMAAAERILLNPALEKAMRDDWSDPSTVRFPLELKVEIDPVYAVNSSWYEFFPRSRWMGMAEKGTLKDAADRLAYVAGLGFDIVYLPPIHPIGDAFRKGKNNTLKPEKGDVGSPWAIGNKEGGHKSILPALGTFADFDALVEKARALDLKIALDIAFQCSPDHPYVKAHPEWFKHRADGTIQYAENPPKKYQDIYPFDFECSEWRSLWDELLSVLVFWADKGVRVFRVDNPHTKAFPFWEWALGEMRKQYPDAIFLAEAFAKPHVMAYLAKIGFNQSYTYFAWRQTKAELIEYMHDLTQTELKDYFRPNFWPNTPDILTLQLQHGGRPVFAQRLILAATLSASYGIYGPVYELMEYAGTAPGKEEYLNSEKYESRIWDVDTQYGLAPLIKRINRIRKENAALQSNSGLMFHSIDNDQMIAYTKHSGDSLMLMIVNLDIHNRQAGMVDLKIEDLGIDPEGTYEVHDLLSDARYRWHGWKNYVELDPNIVPAHIFRIERQ